MESCQNGALRELSCDVIKRREICVKTCLQKKRKKVAYFCQTTENCELIKESLHSRIKKAHANSRK